MFTFWPIRKVNSLLDPLKVGAQSLRNCAELLGFDRGYKAGTVRRNHIRADCELQERRPFLERRE